MATSSLTRSQLLLRLLVMAALLALASAHGGSNARDVEHPKGGYVNVHMGGYYKQSKKDDKYKGPNKDVKEGPHPGGSYSKPDEDEDESNGEHDDEPNGEHDDDSNQPAPFKPPRLVSLAVEGVVSCQDCKFVGSKSLTNAKPLAATTDKNGFFFLRVPHFEFSKFTPLDDCAVFLISSPVKTCSNPTNINYGKTGAPLRPIPTFAPSSEAFFSVGPLAFAPQPCIKRPPIKYPAPPPATTPKNPPPYATPAPITRSPPPPSPTTPKNPPPYATPAPTTRSPPPPSPRTPKSPPLPPPTTPKNPPPYASPAPTTGSPLPPSPTLPKNPPPYASPAPTKTRPPPPY